MIPNNIKRLVEEYCMGLEPTETQENEIMDAVKAAGLDAESRREVVSYMAKLMAGPTREQIAEAEAARKRAEEEKKRREEEERLKREEEERLWKEREEKLRQERAEKLRQAREEKKRREEEERLKKEEEEKLKKEQEEKLRQERAEKLRQAREEKKRREEEEERLRKEQEEKRRKEEEKRRRKEEEERLKKEQEKAEEELDDLKALSDSVLSQCDYVISVISSQSKDVSQMADSIASKEKETYKVRKIWPIMAIVPNQDQKNDFKSIVKQSFDIYTEYKSNVEEIKNNREKLQKIVSSNSRKMYKVTCLSCGKTWNSPNPTKCPNCESDKLRKEETSKKLSSLQETTRSVMAISLDDQNLKNDIVSQYEELSKLYKKIMGTEVQREVKINWPIIITVLIVIFVIALCS